MHDPVQIIVRMLDWICAELLTPVLVETVPHLEKHGEMTVNQKPLELPGTVSVSTAKRTVNQVRQDE